VEVEAVRNSPRADPDSRGVDVGRTCCFDLQARGSPIQTRVVGGWTSYGSLIRHLYDHDDRSVQCLSSQRKDLSDVFGTPTVVEADQGTHAKRAHEHVHLGQIIARPCASQSHQKSAYGGD
jgi:hypothetical protein